MVKPASHPFALIKLMPTFCSMDSLEVSTLDSLFLLIALGSVHFATHERLLRDAHLTLDVGRLYSSIDSHRLW